MSQVAKSAAFVPVLLVLLFSSGSLSAADDPPSPPPSVPISPPPPFHASAEESKTAELDLRPPVLVGKQVRVRVNDEPLYEVEFRMCVPSSLYRELSFIDPTDPESESKKKIQEKKFQQGLTESEDQLIDTELLYQDAVRKLNKANPKMVAKLREYAFKEHEKHIQSIRENAPKMGIKTDAALKEIMPFLWRKAQREWFVREYLRSRIMPERYPIGPDDIKEYYDKHSREFEKPESVTWQHLFIAVGAEHATLADARLYAQRLIAKCRTGEDFKKLISEHTTKEDDRIVISGGPDGCQFQMMQPGDGQGSCRGDIRPAELEPILFRLHDGDIGPIVEIANDGVHIVRMVKHHPGGLVPLDKEVQAQIRNRLRGEMFEREHRKLIRQLRSQATIAFEHP
jgi:PPIC-type PPIASE domain